MKCLHILPVEGFTWNRSKVDIINTAHIDARFREGDAFGMRLRAADSTEVVPGLLFVELVFLENLLARKKLEFILVHKIEEHAFLRAVRAVAFHYLGNLAFKFVPHRSAMTSASMFRHACSIPFWYTTHMTPMQHLTVLWKLRTLMQHPIRTFRVFLDRETPLTAKVLPLVAILYAAFPLDFLPDIFPILGWFDDVSILVLLLGYSLSRIPDDVYHRAGLDPARAKIDYHNELP